MRVLTFPNPHKSIMITQEEFVADCYLDYAVRGLEPGNVMYGDWNKCHFPVPKCLGGTEWIWLLEEHHAVQGVLQSLEYNHCCVRSWEKKFLVGEWEFLYPLYREIKKNAMLKARGTVEEASQRSKQNTEKYKEEGRLFWDSEWQREQGRKGFLKQPKEVRVAAGKKTTSMKVRCTVTGHISTPGGIGQWQKKRGIDPSNREFLH